MSDSAALPPAPTTESVASELQKLEADIKQLNPVAPSVTPTQTQAKVGQVLDDWLNGLRNTPLSQNTPAWNYLQNQLTVLRKQLYGVL